MWIRISKEFCFEYIAEPLVKYYIHGNRLSTNYLIMINGLETLLKKYDRYFSLNRKAQSKLYLNIGVYYGYSGNIEKARKSLLKAIRIYPFETRHYFNLFLTLLGANKFQKLKEIKEKLFSPI
jgi:tetratricopeptide (TPR) repeat protein